MERDSGIQSRLRNVYLDRVGAIDSRGKCITTLDFGTTHDLDSDVEGSTPVTVRHCPLFQG
jgi:hypothetical protein